MQPIAQSLSKYLIASYLVLFCGLLLLPAAWAADTNPALPLSQYGIDTWNGADGLPQARIRAIIQTRDGYLWLGTANGLVRFDGVTFTTYGMHDEVGCLTEDNEGALWVGTYGGGLSRFKNGQFTNYTTADGLPDNAIRKVAEDPEGNIWIATPRGMVRYSQGHFTTFTTADGLPDNFITALCTTAPRGVYVAAGGRLSRFVSGKFVTEPGVVDDSDGRMDMMTSGSDGALWMTFETSEIKRWKDGRLTTYTRADHKSNRPGAIYEDAQGTIWIGTRDGLLRCQDGKFDALTTSEARAKLGVVLSMFADPEGNLWVGTEANGLVRLRTVPVRMLTAEEGLSDNSTRCIYRDRRGDIWIGTYMGFNRLSHGQVTAISQSDGNPIPTVTSICEDSAGRLWIAAAGRLYTWENERLNPIAGWTKVFDIKVMARDQLGNMWIGTDGEGLFRFTDGKITRFRTRDGLGNNQIRTIFCDHRGVLWVGTTTGLSRYQDGKFKNFDTADGLRNGRIMSLYEDADGALWMGTRDGLSRFQNGHFFNITDQDGLPDSYIFNVLDDGQGNFWLSNGRGICSVRKADLDALVAGKRKSVEALPLGYRDGMRTSLLVAGTQPNACQDQAGQLLFCSLKGMVIVSPQNRTFNNRVPPMYIEQVLVNRQEKSVDCPGSLPPGSGEIEIHYTALSYVAPEKVRFKYRLEGMDTGWVDAGLRRFAHYASLPPGSYRFQVIACNNDGVWNETGASYSFRLAPHFYQARWFPVVVLLFLGGLAWAGYRLRVHQLEAHERKLQQRVDEALAEVKVLSGLLPICGGCKKIRDDKGYWNQIESYIMRHADIQFSHSLCPDCMKRLFPECADEVLEEMKATHPNPNPSPPDHPPVAK